MILWFNIKKKIFKTVKQITQNNEINTKNKNGPDAGSDFGGAWLNFAKPRITGPSALRVIQ